MSFDQLNSYKHSDNYSDIEFDVSSVWQELNNARAEIEEAKKEIRKAGNEIINSMGQNLPGRNGSWSSESKWMSDYLSSNYGGISGFSGYTGYNGISGYSGQTRPQPGEYVPASGFSGPKIKNRKDQNLTKHSLTSQDVREKWGRQVGVTDTSIGFEVHDLFTLAHLLDYDRIDGWDQKVHHGLAKQIFDYYDK